MEVAFHLAAGHNFLNYRSGTLCLCTWEVIESAFVKVSSSKGWHPGQLRHQYTTHFTNKHMIHEGKGMLLE